jgi:CubicO group peptidase (beta-lactamase class C family)
MFAQWQVGLTVVALLPLAARAVTGGQFLPRGGIQDVPLQRPLRGNNGQHVAADPIVCDYFIDIDPVTFIQNVNTCKGQGQWPASISIYGQPAKPSLAVTFSTKKKGQNLDLVAGVNATVFASQVTKWNATGMKPILISATGTVGAEVYAAIAMTAVRPEPQPVKCGMTDAQFKDTIASVSLKSTLLSATTYGNTATRRYCAIWQPRENAKASPRYSMSVAAEDREYYRIEAIEYKKRYAPTLLFPHGDNKTSAIFTDTCFTFLPRDYVGLNKTAFETQHRAEKAAGRKLSSLQVASKGNGLEVAAIWATNDVPVDRIFSANHIEDTIPAGDSAKLDEIFRLYMADNRVRQIQFAVASGNRVLVSRAYTFAEPPYNLATTPSDTFLIGQLSQIFTAATVQMAINKNKLKATDNVYAKMGITSTSDPSMQNITVQHLIDHKGGYNYTALYKMRVIANEMLGGRSLPTPWDYTRWLATKWGKLGSVPGTTTNYYSQNYILLGQLVANATGQPFVDFMRTSVLDPSDKVGLWETNETVHKADTVWQEANSFGPDVLRPADRTAIAPDVFGGDGMYKETAFAAAAMRASAATIARFIGTHREYKLPVI